MFFGWILGIAVAWIADGLFAWLWTEFIGNPYWGLSLKVQNFLAKHTYEWIANKWYFVYHDLHTVVLGGLAGIAIGLLSRRWLLNAITLAMGWVLGWYVLAVLESRRFIFVQVIRSIPRNWEEAWWRFIYAESHLIFMLLLATIIASRFNRHRIPDYFGPFLTKSPANKTAETFEEEQAPDEEIQTGSS